MTKVCDPNCISCHGGHAPRYITKSRGEGDDSGPCLLCGGVPVDTVGIVRQHFLVEMRLDELTDLLRLFHRQLRVGDPLRSFNLGKARGLVDEITKIESMDVAAFQDRPKKRAVNSKVE